MSLKLKRFSKSALALTALGLTLAACDDDVTLGRLGDKIDRPPNFDTSEADSRPQPDANGVITYPTYQIAVAQNGDTVGSIADRVGISADRLASYNGLTVDTPMRKGEIVAIPNGAVLSSTGSIEDIASSALDDAPSSATQVQTGDEPVRHTVRSGETAYSIARLYNVSVTALASWNGLGPDLSLRDGQRLLIPTSPDVASDLTVSDPGAGTPTPTPTTSTKPLPDPVEAVVKEPTKPAAPAKMIRPVDGKVLRGFSKKSGGNEGIDYAAATGTTVKAAATGKVALISNVGDTKIILLRHSNNIYTVYSNLTGVTLKKGNKVNAGEPVGIVAGGNPPFVHFEVRKGTEAVDPASYL